jgi:hypothetical protein
VALPQGADARAGAIDLLLLGLKQGLVTLPEGVTIEELLLSDARMHLGHFERTLGCMLAACASRSSPPPLTGQRLHPDRRPQADHRRHAPRRTPAESADHYLAQALL